MHFQKLQNLVEHVAKPPRHQEGVSRDGIELALAIDSSNGMEACFPPSEPHRYKWENLRLLNIDIAKTSVDLVQATGKHGVHQASATLGGRPKMRVIVTAYENGIYLAVIARAGHEVVKSLSRMIRIAARREGIRRLISPSALSSQSCDSRAEAPISDATQRESL